MPVSCFAWGCTNRYTTENKSRGMTFHRLPKNLEMREQWGVAIRRQGCIRSQHSVLCSDHFKPGDFDRTGQTVRIREGVIPSVFKFPPHSKKLPLKRTTRTSRKAMSSKAEDLGTKQAVTRVKVENAEEAQQSLPIPVSQDLEPEALLKTEDHSYALSGSLIVLKARLSRALARVESLEREMRNVKDRERRAKRTIIYLLQSLRRQNKN